MTELLHQDQIVRCGVAVVCLREGEVLFIKRARSHGVGEWSSPGGWMEFGEDPTETARREVLEETGLNVTGLEKIGWTNDIFTEWKKHSLTLWYYGKVEGHLVVNAEEVDDWRWVNPATELFPKPLFLPLKNLITSGWSVRYGDRY